MLSSRWLALSCALAGSVCVWGRSDTDATDSINALNSQIVRAPQAPGAEALLRKRLPLLQALIRSNPDRALALALSDDVIERLRSAHPSLDPQLERRDRWEGKAFVLVEDSADLRTSRTSLWMHSSAGELHIYPAHAVPLLPGTRTYRVDGVRVGNDVAAASVVPLDATAPTDSCSTTGNQKTIAFLVRAPGSPEPAFTLDQVKDWMFGSGLSLDGYWSDASYGKTSASGDVVGWYDLAQAYSADQYGTLTEAVFQLAAAQGLYLNGYSRVFIFLPQLQNQGDVAGLSVIGCIDWPQAGSNVHASVEWVFPTANGTPNEWLSVAIHEGGHGLGLDHSTALNCGIVSPGPAGDDCSTSEYGDPYSEMGGALLGHYAAPQKYALGWLQDADVSTLPVSGTAHLQPLSAQVSGTKALRVPRTANGTDWLWLEAREPFGTYETTALTHHRLTGGAVIHYQPQVPAGPVASLTRTQLVDVRPGSLANGNGAAVAPGSSWTDVFSGLTFGVAQATDAGLDVSVSRDNACATLSASSTTIGGVGGAGSIQVAAPAGCSWNASSSSAWLSIQGAASGVGNGTVHYQAAANAGIARQGMLMIGGRGVLVTQSAQNSPPVIVGADPQNSAGPSAALALVVSDNVPGNLATVWFNIAGGPATQPMCMGAWDMSSQSLRLMNDDGVTWSPSASGAMDLENSHCAVLSALSEYGGADDTQVSLMLRVVWRSAPAGMQTLYLRATDRTGNDTGWQSVGSWAPTMDRAPEQPVMPNVPGKGFQQAFVVQAADPDGASDVHTIEVDIGSGLQVCSMIYSTDRSAVEFLNDDGSRSGWLTGNPTVATGQDCSLDLLRTSSTANGNTLTLILPVTLKSTLAGAQPVKVVVKDWAGATGQLTSSWTVGASAATPVISAAGILNGASWTGGAISPGEIVTIFGSSLGPSTLQTAAYVGNELEHTVAGTVVFFNGVAAPLIYASDSAVTAIVPLVYGDSISVEVASAGGLSNVVAVPTAPETPGIFTYPSSLQAVAVNQDGSYNSDTPEARGSYITFFITGFGLCAYNNAEYMNIGAIPPASPWALPQFGVSVQFGSDAANQAEFAGLTWPGVVQVNAIVDPAAPTGDAVPLRVVIRDPALGVQSSVAATVRIR